LVTCEAAGARAVIPDLGASLRDWLNARDLRRWVRGGSLPPSVERTYWTAYEYQRDLGRLQQHMYRVTWQQTVTPYPDTSPNITPSGPARVRARSNRSVMLYRVNYERLSYSGWAATAQAAARR
jgi:hypothetical protein